MVVLKFSDADDQARLHQVAGSLPFLFSSLEETDVVKEINRIGDNTSRHR